VLFRPDLPGPSIDRNFNDGLLTRDLNVEAINETAAYRLKLTATDDRGSDIDRVQRPTLRICLGNFSQRPKSGIGYPRLRMDRARQDRIACAE